MMNQFQKMINKFIDQNFTSGSVSKQIENNNTIKITDRNGDSLRLSMNLFCDILDADTKKIIAESNIPHNMAKVAQNPYMMATKWTNVQANWIKEGKHSVLPEKAKQSVKAQLSYFQNKMEKADNENKILQNERQVR